MTKSFYSYRIISIAHAVGVDFLIDDTEETLSHGYDVHENEDSVCYRKALHDPWQYWEKYG